MLAFEIGLLSASSVLNANDNCNDADRSSNQRGDTRESGSVFESRHQLPTQNGLLIRDYIIICGEATKPAFHGRARFAARTASLRELVLRLRGIPQTSHPDGGSVTY